MRSDLWSPEDWARVVRLRSEGYTIKYVAARIGRTYHQLKSKISWEEMSVEQRENRAARLRSYKRKTIKTGRELEFVRACDRPALETLEDRERRHAAGPRDLTGAFFGDPPKGFSALERRA